MLLHYNLDYIRLKMFIIILSTCHVSCLYVYIEVFLLSLYTYTRNNVHDVIQAGVLRSYNDIYLAIFIIL